MQFDLVRFVGSGHHSSYDCMSMSQLLMIFHVISMHTYITCVFMTIGVASVAFACLFVAVSPLQVCVLNRLIELNYSFDRMSI